MTIPTELADRVTRLLHSSKDLIIGFEELESGKQWTIEKIIIKLLNALHAMEYYDYGPTPEEIEAWNKVTEIEVDRETFLPTDPKDAVRLTAALAGVLTSSRP